MHVHVSYKGSKTPAVEREFQQQIKRLARRLHVFKPELVHLRAFVDQENTRNAGSSLNLRLPSGQMAAQGQGETSLAAVKAAFADLLSQVTRHKELLRGRWSRREALDLQTAAPRRSQPIPPIPMTASASSRVIPPAHMGGAVTEASLDQWINANLARLQGFVDSELEVRIAAGQLREDQVSCEEVIDEVMVSALSQEDGRAELLSPESWFHRLALQAVQRLAKSNADTGTLSLDAPAGRQNVTGSDENVLQYHQPDDTLQEENVIGDSSVRTPEEIFAGEEMVAQLNIVLHEVKTQDREAFVLYTLEGFTVDEIARLVDRPPDQVRKSIQHARERIQAKLPEANEFRRSLLRSSHVA